MTASNHTALYCAIFAAEAALFYMAWRRGFRAPGQLQEAFGLMDDSWRRRAIDVLAAAALWGAWMLIQSVVANALPTPPHNVEGLLPHGLGDTVLWVVVSCAAGIAEELLFRGYLRRAFTTLTRNAFAAVLLQAVAFGVAHGYQGVAACVHITIFGIIFGLVALYTRSLRICMIAHAWTDIAAGLIGI